MSVLLRRLPISGLRVGLEAVGLLIKRGLKGVLSKVVHCGGGLVMNIWRDLDIEWWGRV